MALSSWILSWKRSVERRWVLHQALRRKTVASRCAPRPHLEALEDRWLLSTYTVTSAADDGSAGTLRYGITQANMAGSTITEIDFDIGTVGSAQTISLTSQLPALKANGVFINGLSQGGSGNTKQLITLDGTNAGTSSDGLLLQGSKDIVSGLIIEHFTNNGIEVAGSTNTIGGTTTGAGNIISGNTADGVLIDNGVSGVAVQGNYIGTDATGAKAVANKVGVEADGYASTIGGTASAARNLISGNSSAGVLINHGGNISTGTLVLGNYIGTNAAGNAALPNNIGMLMYSGSNTIGGSTSGAGNLISGNSSDGVLISENGNSNLVLNNFIGTNAAGNAVLPNAGSGLDIYSSNNTVGGAAPGSGNLISGNSSDGLNIGPGTGNLVLGNSIGTNAAGNAALPNASGLGINGGNSTIGGTASGAGNLISGNRGVGVLISSGSNSNLVLGNSIGTNLTGDAALANDGGGLAIDSSGNTIGGTASGARNLISGNGSDGVHIGGGSTEVLGNSIGTNAAGNAALANAGSGIFIGEGTSTIGGTASGARNLISGNGSDGVHIGDGSTEVLGNYIGTNAAGNAAVPNSIGIFVMGTSNTIGGTTAAARNLISGNLADGVLLEGDSAVNDFQGNYIGTDVTGAKAVANSIGVDIEGSNITFGSTAPGARNIISGNSAEGVLIDRTGVTVQGNYIGINAAGNAALANSIGIEVLGSTLPNQVAGGNDTIGGMTSSALNVISGNSADGVRIDNGASGVAVQGNYIGTNAAGNAALANRVGVEIAYSNNTIGGTISGDRNVISGNRQDGIVLGPGISGVVVQGNYIGTNATGNAALANFNGIDSTDNRYNTIGGTVSAARNLISGNSNYAVSFDGSTGNQVLGNYIGTNAAGNAALANHNGLSFDFAISNTVGGTVSGAANLISGNGDGVDIDNSTGNQVLGNYIGTNATGNATIANSTGIGLIGSDNTIGGTGSGARNLISGNTSAGMDIGGSGNQVLGNYIGTNAAGNAALANGDGIFVGGSNTVGGTVSGAANLISGNGNAGVYIVGSGVQVLGNSIGTNAAGNAALANYDGIFVFASSATIGGTVSGASNLISGNSHDGVNLDSSGNQVLGNRIGTNAAGNAALANGYGIEVGGSSNTVGGSVSGASNLISGNSDDGVQIGDSGNQVLGNFIGTNAAGNAALANSVGIEVMGTSNTVGGMVSGAANLISGNSAEGVSIAYGISGNQVLGNSIGTNAAGSGALANSVGIEVSGSNNTIGGTASGTLNLISGNTADGVLIDGGASGVAVQGNYIGTNASGSAALGNSIGIAVSDSNNTIGGIISGARNIISGNTADGVSIVSGVSGMAVQGNYIGTDATGTKAVANSIGVDIEGSNNTIGSTITAARNIISGNSAEGVLIAATGVTAQGNYVGVNSSGNAALANSIGIEVAGSTIPNQVAGGNDTIGGTSSSALNVISGNSADGVLIDRGASGVQVQGNYIGTNPSGVALGNGHYGVNISGSNNTIGGSVASAGNIIADNTQGGVFVNKGSGNTIRLNSIFANGNTHAGPGITLSNGANNNLAAPTLHSATLNGGTLTVHGSFQAPTANVSYVLDFFANPTGDAEGKVYLGSLTVTPTRTGNIPFTFTTATTVTGTNPLITATLTDASGDTSSFSNGVTVHGPQPNNPPPSPPPVLNVPPLLAFINSLFGGGIETLNGNGTITIKDYLFGIPLLVSTFNSSGQLMSVSFMGIDLTFLFG